VSQPTVNYQQIYNDHLEDNLKDSLGLPSRFSDLNEDNKRLVEALVDYSYNYFCDILLQHEQVKDLEYLSKEISETLDGLLLSIRDLKGSLLNV